MVYGQLFINMVNIGFYQNPYEKLVNFSTLEFSQSIGPYLMAIFTSGTRGAEKGATMFKTKYITKCYGPCNFEYVL